MQNRLRWLAIITVMFVGCGKYDATVQGTVKYDGKLLDRGTVSFYPASGGAATYGQIQSDGSFEIKTGSDLGLSAGEYKVAVQSVERILAEKRGDPPRAKTLIPVVYKDPNKSGLQFTVTRGGNDFNIDLPRVGK